MGQSLEAFMQWKALVSLLLSCSEAVSSFWWIRLFCGIPFIMTKTYLFLCWMCTLLLCWVHSTSPSFMLKALGLIFCHIVALLTAGHMFMKLRNHASKWTVQSHYITFYLRGFNSSLTTKSRHLVCVSTSFSTHIISRLRYCTSCIFRSNSIIVYVRF